MSSTPECQPPWTGGDSNSELPGGDPAMIPFHHRPICRWRKQHSKLKLKKNTRKSQEKINIPKLKLSARVESERRVSGFTIFQCFVVSSCLICWWSLPEGVLAAHSVD